MFLRLVFPAFFLVIQTDCRPLLGEAVLHLRYGLFVDFFPEFSLCFGILSEKRFYRAGANGLSRYCVSRQDSGIFEYLVSGLLFGSLYLQQRRRIIVGFGLELTELCCFVLERFGPLLRQFRGAVGSEAGIRSISRHVDLLVFTNIRSFILQLLGFDFVFEAFLVLLGGELLGRHSPCPSLKGCDERIGISHQQVLGIVHITH